MRFEVFDMYGNAMMGCSHPSCVPSDKEIKDMYAAGFKFKLDGKAISPKKITEWRNELKEK